MNFCNLIDEGGFSRVYCEELRGERAAFKVFKSQLSKRHTRKIAGKLMNLNHENIVSFLGYSYVPCTAKLLLMMKLYTIYRNSLNCGMMMESLFFKTDLN